MATVTPKPEIILGGWLERGVQDVVGFIFFNCICCIPNIAPVTFDQTPYVSS